MTEKLGRRQGLRELNQLRIVDVLRRHSEASRAEIGLATGLSRAAVSTHVAELMSQGLVIESPPRGEDRYGRGRRPTTLRLENSAGIVLAMVFDRDGLRAGVTDLSYSLIAERAVRVGGDPALPVQVYDLDGQKGADPVTVLDAAASVGSDLLEKARIDKERVLGVGLGLPAPIDRRTSAVASDTILHHWKDVDTAAELSRWLRLPAEVDNDANLGALAELFLGAGRGLSDFIYVKQSPGVGSALILSGRLYRGASGIAGELGHVQVQADGPICDGCGQRGCLGTVVSGKALLAALRSSHGQGLSASDIPALAQADAVAARMVGDAGRVFGRVLADLCNELNPEAIIVQGELSTPEGPFLIGIREGIDRGAIPAAAAAVTVKPSLLGERAELLGAAALVITNTESWSSSSFLALGKSHRRAVRAPKAAQASTSEPA
ncbi:MAG: ROK family protein [Gaiellaceae bacterium]